jgi:hypothetical protein
MVADDRGAGLPSGPGDVVDRRLVSYEMILSRWDEQTPYLGLSGVRFGGPTLLGMALLAYSRPVGCCANRWRRC